MSTSIMSTFVLSEVLESREIGFNIFSPDFDWVLEEHLKEEAELAQKLHEFGIEYPVIPKKTTYSKEEYVGYLRDLVQDPFIYENGLRAVLLKGEKLVIGFTKPGGQKVFWVTFDPEEIKYFLKIEAQESLLRLNPRIFPYVDDTLIDIEKVKFFKSRKGLIYVKFMIAFSGSGKTKEVIYEVESNSLLLSIIKTKFDIGEDIENAWKEFQAKNRKKIEVRRAIDKALRIFKKESGFSDWLQYTVKFSDSILYIFKPRLSRNGVYYSIFIIRKGSPQLGIPDKVEPLFAVSAEEFLSKWEDLLERRK